MWKFLLGYYPWETTIVERKELRDQKVEEYFRMKLQWRSLSAKQETRFAAFKQRKDLIGIYNLLGIIVLRNILIYFLTCRERRQPHRPNSFLLCRR